MKKLLLIFAVLFATASSSFAFQTYSLYSYSANDYQNGQVNINSYCNYIGMQCYFTPDEGGRGSAGAYEGSSIIGQFAFIDGYTSSSYANAVYNQSWGTVQVYLNNQTSYAYVNLFWE